MIYPALVMYGHGCQQIAVGAGREQDAPNSKPLPQPAGNSNTRQTIIGDQQRSIHPLGLKSFTDNWINWPAIHAHYAESVMSSHTYLVSCVVFGFEIGMVCFLGGRFSMGVEWAEWAGLQH